jgi:hypothetical protein
MGLLKFAGELQTYKDYKD